MPATGRPRSKRHALGVVLAILSVLVPALIIGGIAWWADDARHDAMLAELETRSPAAERVAQIYLEALGEDWRDVAQAAATPEWTEQTAGTNDGYRGLSDVEVSPGREEAGVAVVTATFTTARPLGSDAPGAVARSLTLEQRDGRWYVANVSGP